MPLDALVSGRIATFAGESGFGWVEALGIKDGTVAFAGSAVELESRADPHTLRIDLAPGEIAIPGITDAHLHLADAAMAADEVDLSAARTLEDGLALLAEADRRLPAGAWIEGGGWDQRRWGRWPAAADLDAALPGRKVAIWSFDHHAVWASGAALTAAGIDARTQDPPGGIIRRLPDGSPEGVVLENACSLLTDHVPPPGEDVLSDAIVRETRRLLALGVVGVHDPGHVSPDPGMRALAVYGRLADAGDLAIRVHAGIRSDALAGALERGLRSGDPLGEDAAGRARMGWLKLFADGTLGSRTAALLEPIEGPDGGAEAANVWRMPPDVLAELARRAADGGIASQIHAIGDAAVRAALDALEPTAARVPFMPRVEHVQLCHPDDRARFAAGGIAASVQPVHLREDAATARRDWGARAETRGYTWRTFLDDGIVVAFGTDAPVEPIDPWPGIAIAVLRRDPSWGDDALAFGPDESLTLEQSLRAACVAPPATARDVGRGRLGPGSSADLLVLPAAPRGEGEPGGAGFAAVRPRLVLVDGEVAWEA
jgi:predicted amidohydrolase YtcJ